MFALKTPPNYCLLKDLPMKFVKATVLTHNFYAQDSTLVSNLILISLCLMALCSRTSLQLSGSFKFSAN